MKQRVVGKIFVYFLCISLLLLMGGFERMVAEARERDLPFGEMVSKGDVLFEARQNIWRKAEPSHFPIFQGTKIKTEQGLAVISLSNDSRIEVGEKSFLSFDQADRIYISKGDVNFRIPPGADIDFRVGKITVTRSRVLQAGKNTPGPSSNEETIGSISILPNGSVMVKSLQGPLSIVNQDLFIAGLASKESVTIPANTVRGAAPMVAQAGEATAETSGAAGIGAGTYLGLSTATWIGIGAAAVAVGVGVGVASSGGGGGGDETAPLCP